jgi:hypothetical protein
MICVSCGATIADKAIVCYRCGTPTAIPAAARPDRPGGRRPSGSPVAAVLFLLIGLALALFAQLSDTVTSWMANGRTLLTAVGVILAMAGAWLMVRRR